jgi:hypothetical protein
VTGNVNGGTGGVERIPDAGLKVTPNSERFNQFRPSGHAKTARVTRMTWKHGELAKHARL